jgi:diaminopimelate decarboxylase
VLKALIEEGAGFEIASIAELDLLLGLGVNAADIYYSNPMKSARVHRVCELEGCRVVRRRHASTSCARW